MTKIKWITEPSSDSLPQTPYIKFPYASFLEGKWKLHMRLIDADTRVLNSKSAGYIFAWDDENSEWKLI